mmetsp:Transcript_19968/g.41125  ORF Transcript_19968/g.41125 Transcript_19968/m.41125 type:complete len:84 (-) Transcript_19968:95-346(-)
MVREFGVAIHYWQNFLRTYRHHAVGHLSSNPSTTSINYSVSKLKITKMSNKSKDTNLHGANLRIRRASSNHLHDPYFSRSISD